VNNAFFADVQHRALSLFMSRGVDGFSLSFAGDDYYEIIATFEDSAEAFAARLAAAEALGRLMQIAGVAA
jgi:hypothetical protein